MGGRVGAVGAMTFEIEISSDAAAVVVEIVREEVPDLKLTESEPMA